MLDRGAKTWIAHRIVVFVKCNRAHESETLRRVRDMLAGVAWEDLAPCRGCNLPCVKAEGVSCAMCRVFIACGPACDPWASCECRTCGKLVCKPCAKALFPDRGKFGPYCMACLLSPPTSATEPSNSDAE